MIVKGSRYEKVGIYEAVDADGNAVKALKLRLIPETPAGYQHLFKSGDRLDLLAYTYYRNSEKFWLIADANPEMDPDDLVAEPGRQLLIPPDRTI